MDQLLLLFFEKAGRYGTQWCVHLHPPS